MNLEKYIRVPTMTTTKVTEEHINLAMTLKDNNFLHAFLHFHKEAYTNYYKLCEENNMLEEYLANPLLFILLNEPSCCLKYAIDFIEKRLVLRTPKPFQEGHTCECGSVFLKKNIYKHKKTKKHIKYIEEASCGEEDPQFDEASLKLMKDIQSGNYSWDKCEEKLKKKHSGVRRKGEPTISVKLKPNETIADAMADGFNHHDLIYTWD